MSSFLQFFPNTNQQNIGGGSIPVEILGMGGGGGGGTGTCVQSQHSLGGGTGGDGGLFHATNYFLNPAITYPITIGAGGAGGIAGGRDGAPTAARIEDVGDPGGATIFNNPACVLCAQGGGGGGAGIDCSYIFETPGSPGTFSCSPTGRGCCYPIPCISPLWYTRCGCPGGNGGGSGAASYVNVYGPSTLEYSNSTSLCGSSCPQDFWNKFEAGSGAGNTKAFTNEQQLQCSCMPGTPAGYLLSEYDNNITEGEGVTCPWGIMRGYPGNSALYCWYSPTAYHCALGGCGGHNSGNAVQMFFSRYTCPGGLGNARFGNIDAYYTSSITGTTQHYGCTRGAGGAGNPSGPPVPISCCCYGIGNGSSGCAGVLIIKYPSAYGPAPSFPGGTNISPSTPGYYTYCFTSSGSITLP